MRKKNAVADDKSKRLNAFKKAHGHSDEVMERFEHEYIMNEYAERYFSDPTNDWTASSEEVEKSRINETAKLESIRNKNVQRNLVDTFHDRKKSILSRFN